MAETKIGIIGKGVVGTATARVWQEHAEVRCYDKQPARSTHTFDEIAECDFVFVCLPTPEGLRGRPDVSAVGDCLDRMRDSLWVMPIVIKSTVKIGSTRHWAEVFPSLRLFHSPEFLTERCSIADAHTPSRTIVGATSRAGVGCLREVVELHRKRFPGIPCLLMTSDESEAVKLMANNLFATKVAFFNEWHKWVGHHGLDWEKVRAGVMSDGRIAHAHTQVPGPDGKYGFGGTCLPKDLANTVSHAEVEGVSCPVMKAVQTRNFIDRGECS
jgi:UDPglucose 6-dehydrogenase